MGCAPSFTPPTAVKPAEQVATHSTLIFSIDERLKLKEVWVIVKQNNLKKLGEDVMNRALEKSGSVLNYWDNIAFLDQSNNLNFGENDSCLNTDFLSKQAYKHHGYQLIEKIDQLIMLMVTRISSNNTNDSVLHDYFHRIGAAHSQCKIKQDHIDVLCESFLECLKNLMYHNEMEWTIKHEITWMKFFSLITSQFLVAAAPLSLSTTTTKTAS